MMNAANELTERGRICQRWMHGYLRVMSVIVMFMGLYYWMQIVGVINYNGFSFIELSMPLKTTIICFAVLDLVVSTGLWLLTSWGAAMWLFRSLAQVVMHTVLSSVYGRSMIEVIFYMSAIAIYLVLLYLAEREG